MVKKIVKNKQLITVLLVTFIGAFIRLYGIVDGMPFTFDQAEFYFYVRDIVGGKPVLIGPRTGIEGFFLGPLYFYLLVPFYLIFDGHPAGGAVMDAIFGILVIPAIYVLTKELFNRKVAYITAILACFSPLLVAYSRYSWNPHPLVFFSIIFYWAILRVLKGEEKFIVLAFLAFSIGLQLEIASAIFFIPTVFLLFIWTRYKPKNFWFWCFGLVILLLSLVPQVAFNIRHEFLTVKALVRYLQEKKSFTQDWFYFIKVRLGQYFSAFRDVLVAPKDVLFPLILMFSGTVYLKRIFKERPLIVKLIICWLSVNFFFLFFSGEQIWQHHFISLFPVFIIVASLAIYNFLRWRKDKIIAIIIAGLFFYVNFYSVWPRKQPEEDGALLFKHQLTAIDYIYKDAGGRNFNVFIYVPSVYDHSYRYIFEWYGKDKYGYLPTDGKKQKRVYFIIEPDNQLAERRLRWKTSHEGEGKKIGEKKFGGGLVVEKRRRK